MIRRWSSPGLSGLPSFVLLPMIQPSSNIVSDVNTWRTYPRSPSGNPICPIESLFISVTYRKKPLVRPSSQRSNRRRTPDRLEAERRFRILTPLNSSSVESTMNFGFENPAHKYTWSGHLPPWATDDFSSASVEVLDWVRSAGIDWMICPGRDMLFLLAHITLQMLGLAFNSCSAWFNRVGSLATIVTCAPLFTSMTASAFPSPADPPVI